MKKQPEVKQTKLKGGGTKLREKKIKIKGFESFSQENF
jgi:hypothetical protein